MFDRNTPVLDIKNLKMYFPVTRGLLKKKVADVRAVDGVSFKLAKGETLGLVGESGCGKTTIGRCILGLYRPVAGEIFFEDNDILKMRSRSLQEVKRKMSFIFQDPYSSLDPRQSAGSIVGEPIKIHKLTNTKSEYNDRVDRLFRTVGLDPDMKNRYPHEFSGGQRQRIGIARALACNPSMIICDEPVSALDVSIQAQIINLLHDLQEAHKDLSYIFIAHDLSVVRHISNRIAVMYLGRIVEIADAAVLCSEPLHPYTKALFSAVPIADPVIEENREHIILKGEVPSPLSPPDGCSFHPRCPKATSECSKSVPELREIDPGHSAACIRI